MDEETDIESWEASDLFYSKKTNRKKCNLLWTKYSCPPILKPSFPSVVVFEVRPWEVLIS